LCDLGRYRRVEPLARQLVTMDPDNARAWCVVARAKLGLQQNEGALGAADTAGSKAPEDGQPLRLASVALDRLGRHAEAAEAAAHALNLAQDDWRPYVQLADVLTRVEGRMDDAELVATRAVELAPEEAATHLAAGAVAATAGRRDDAVAALREALRIDPRNSDARGELAKLGQRKSRRRNRKEPRAKGAAAQPKATVQAGSPAPASRGDLDYVVRRFLRYLGYLILIDGIIVVRLGSHAHGSLARVLPLILLLIPGALGLRFMRRRPAEVRREVARAATSGVARIVTAAELLGIAALLTSAVSKPSARPTMAAIAIISGLVSVLILLIKRRAPVAG
jgi:tetratricopeptide (TPR) repeat protein